MSNAEALRVWRQRRGLSQAKAAALIEAKQRTWAAWETGDVAPDLDNCIRLQVLTENEVPAVGWAKRRRKSDDSVTSPANDDDDPNHAKAG